MKIKWPSIKFPPINLFSLWKTETDIEEDDELYNYDITELRGEDEEDKDV